RWGEMNFVKSTKRYQERQHEKACFSGEMKKYLKKRGEKLQNSRAHLV
ncbi:MAG: hypothetical protein BROFUL_02662, partial [Candidatus Brocadia fulgida]